MSLLLLCVGCHMFCLWFRSSLVNNVVSTLDQSLFWFLGNFPFPFKPGSSQQVCPSTHPLSMAQRYQHQKLRKEKFSKSLEFKVRFRLYRLAPYNMFVEDLFYVLTQLIDFRLVFYCLRLKIICM